MAHDDMHVIMYKILSYLYSCMKAGKRPDPESVSAVKLGINEAYWSSVVAELVENGFVRGYIVDRSDDAVHVVPANPSVTMAGVEFLMENSLMAKAKRFVMDMKGFVPSPF